jgi:uncharacterized protein
MEPRVMDIDIDKVKAFLDEKESYALQARFVEQKKLIRDLKELREIWRSFNIKRVYLYGSAAEGRTHYESDVDIAFEGDLNYQQVLNLFIAVDKHILREIDIRDLDELPFKEAVRQQGVIIYEQ